MTHDTPSDNSSPEKQPLWLRWRMALEVAIARIDRTSLQTQALHQRSSPNPGHRFLFGLDAKLVGVVLLACTMLSLIEYYGSSGDWRTLATLLGWTHPQAESFINDIFRDPEYGRLARLIYWSSCTTIGYFLIPALFVRVLLRQSLREMGLAMRGIFRHAWIYFGLYVLVLPAVYLVSRTPSFQKTYPFYEHAARTPFDFIAWELAYALQFFSLEFFYRGFLIHGTKHRLGTASILLSVVPYCMIHFGKPFPETIGAIFAGLALGLLSLTTRSIWFGVAIHISVAVTMDILSLWAQGKL